jgi:hypothetical protein
MLVFVVGRAGAGWVWCSSCGFGVCHADEAFVALGFVVGCAGICHCCCAGAVFITLVFIILVLLSSSCVIAAHITVGITVK